MGSLIHLLRYTLTNNLLRHSPLVACLFLMLFTVGHSATGALMGVSAGLKESTGVFQAVNQRSRRWGSMMADCKKDSPFSGDPEVACFENTIMRCICSKNGVRLN